jgi:hypothetical protein
MNRQPLPSHSAVVVIQELSSSSELVAQASTLMYKNASPTNTNDPTVRSSSSSRAIKLREKTTDDALGLTTRKAASSSRTPVTDLRTR